MSVEIQAMTPLLSVFDMTKSVHFYRDVLGFDVIMTSARSEGEPFGWALLKRADVHLMLNTAYDDGEQPAAPDPKRIAAHRDTILYFRCPDPDAAYEYLRGKGIQAEPPETAYYGMRQVYLHDPDGYNLCFQYPVEAGKAS